ncbi:DUF488 domain-containing protein [Corynebacterium guangdongense]|uniref:Uncharacterized protein (DUF488 family) n=1 Tax=Corynebacterium guangdongense TaxID=1783348 RepID=A0ABU1ZXM2_9CORY|nr:DUF488 domain-containing protein [Corynebacterium guangdongense]MDR7328962.1 uncharacterized protein (DUF488 family) [Corynebacterium guangdongense]WJZ17535.1 hypothetical protein CGUA_04745 [Corynebacterium guangdongense]
MEIFTVGHSNLALDDFIGMLAAAGVTALVDVRKLPGSRKYPHFNDDSLAAALPDAGISYRRSEGLTGRRPVSTTVPFEVNGNWRNRSFHNYADHALGGEFAAAIAQLREDAAAQPTTVMCSEAVWWRCHRRIIADHLLAAGDHVRHIMGPGTLSDATLTEGAVIGEDRLVRYPQQSA